MKTQKIIAIAFAGTFLMAGCEKDSSVFTEPSASAYDFSSDWAVETDEGINAKYNPDIDPEDFVCGINNPYFPLIPGDTFKYEQRIVENGDTINEIIRVTVTNETKVIMGVTCIVVHDVVKEDGIVTENTWDWYAQDEDGNVWYFGEKTKALQDNGTWSTEGSWKAGVDGALPGIIMWGEPEKHLNQKYYQEYYKGYAEDQGKVVNTNSTATIGLGTYTNCIKIKETSKLVPGVVQFKWYAPGLGLVKSSINIGGNEAEELIYTNHQ